MKVKISFIAVNHAGVILYSFFEILTVAEDREEFWRNLIDNFDEVDKGLIWEAPEMKPLGEKWSVIEIEKVEEIV